MEIFFSASFIENVLSFLSNKQYASSLISTVLFQSTCAQSFRILDSFGEERI